MVSYMLPAYVPTSHAMVTNIIPLLGVFAVPHHKARGCLVIVTIWPVLLSFTWSTEKKKKKNVMTGAVVVYI